MSTFRLIREDGGEVTITVKTDPVIITIDGEKIYPKFHPRTGWIFDLPIGDETFLGWTDGKVLRVRKMEWVPMEVSLDHSIILRKDFYPEPVKSFLEKFIEVLQKFFGIK